MIVDGRILFDEQIARRHVGLGLVVIVIGHKILDRIFREKLAKFGVQLGRQRLVGRQHQSGPADPGNDVRHRVGFTRPCYPEQRLPGQSVLYAFGQFADRLGLITRRLKWLVELERTIWESDWHGVKYLLSKPSILHDERTALTLSARPRRNGAARPHPWPDRGV